MELVPAKTLGLKLVCSPDKSKSHRERISGEGLCKGGRLIQPVLW